MSQTEVQLIKTNAVQTGDIANSAVTDEKIAGLTSSKLTGALPAISGASLTNLPASGKAHNLVINGAMKVAQRGTSNSGLDGYGSVDRFYPDKNQLDNLQGTQEQVGISDLPGFTNAFKLDITTAETALAADEYFTIGHRIEAQDLQQLAYGTSSAKSMTLSFHVKSSTTGTYVVSVYQADGGRLITATYTINSANTWEKKVITYPGNTGVAIDDDNAQGLQFNFGLAAGSNWTSANTTSWTGYSDAGYLYGQTANLIAQTGTFFLTGVQLEVGSQATAFEHRSFAEELTLCQRYFQVLGGSNGTYDSMATGSCASSTVAYVPHRLVATMRSTPSFTLVGSASDFRYTKGGDQTPSGLTLDQAGANMVAVRVSAASDHLGTDDAIRLFNVNTTGAFQFSAEI